MKISQRGFSMVILVAVLGLVLAGLMAYIGSYYFNQQSLNPLTVNKPSQTASLPVEDPEACNDAYNADCQISTENDLEDLTPAEIKKLLQE